MSSGARAAAQTLNVPIERLEAQIHSTQTKASSPSSPNHHQHLDKALLQQQQHEDAIISHIEQNGKSGSPSHQYGQQQAYSQQSSLQYNNHNNGNSNGNGNIHHHHHKSNGNSNKDDSNDTDEQMSSLNTSPTAKYSLLQFAMQHFRNE